MSNICNMCISAKISIIAVLLLCICQQGEGQELTPKCVSHDLLESTLAPETRRLLSELDKPDRKSTGTRSDEVIRIPVVVHVLYNKSIENISDVQIKSQVDVLNEDYRKLNTITHSYSQAADTKFEFYLASTDPNGNATTGVVRKFTPSVSFDINLSKALDVKPNINMKVDSLGGSNAWPSDRYLNIWVVNLQDYYKGFATFPLTVPAHLDGVVMNYEFFGRTGTGTKNANFALGRSCTHEIGHWLNLKHIWGETTDCSSSDLVDDTPPQRGYHSGCPKGINTCGQRDMVENFMDYCYDSCLELFTEGQKQRMRSLFDENGPRRSFVLSPSHIGDKVWLDSDMDGLQDTGEAGVADIAVTLHTADGLVMASDTSDQNGNYQLTYPDSGTFYIKLHLPQTYSVTRTNPSSEQLDNDINHENGLNTSRLFTLSQGSAMMEIDAGLIYSNVLAIEDLSTKTEVSNDRAIVYWAYNAEEKVTSAKIYFDGPGDMTEVFEYKKTQTENRGRFEIPDLLPGRHVFKIRLILDNGVSLFSNPIEVMVIVNHGLIRCHPNPGHYLIHVNLPQVVTSSFEEIDIKILDYSGKTIKIEKIRTDLPKLDIGSLPAGLYIISCYMQGQIFSGKFMKI